MDRENCFLLGVGLGCCLGILALLATSEQQKPVIERNAQLKVMITQCEATLPRNETCELVAQKKEGEK